MLFGVFKLRSEREAESKHLNGLRETYPFTYQNMADKEAYKIEELFKKLRKTDTAENETEFRGDLEYTFKLSKLGADVFSLDKKPIISKFDYINSILHNDGMADLLTSTIHDFQPAPEAPQAPKTSAAVQKILDKNKIGALHPSDESLLKETLKKLKTLSDADEKYKPVHQSVHDALNNNIRMDGKLLNSATNLMSNEMIGLIHTDINLEKATRRENLGQARDDLNSLLHKKDLLLEGLSAKIS